MQRLDVTEAFVRRIAARYRRFAEHEAKGNSALYEELGHAVAESRKALAFISRLPPEKQQPNLVFAAVRYACGLPEGRRHFVELLTQRGGGHTLADTAAQHADERTCEMRDVVTGSGASPTTARIARSRCRCRPMSAAGLLWLRVWAGTPGSQVSPGHGRTDISLPSLQFHSGAESYARHRGASRTRHQSGRPRARG
jgi:hypothetical protein